MKKKLIIAFIFLIILISFVFIIWKYYGTNKRTEELISTKVQKGTFNISIISTGEIEAKSSVYIYGPAELKNYGIYQYKISDLIAEGTFVKQGDYVASIDKTEISDKLKALQSELERLQSQLEKNKIDTSLELRNERDKLSGLKFAVRESKVNLDQSKYEPPAVIRQAEIEYEKSKRTLEQAEKNYSLKKEQINNKITENINTIAQTQLKIDDLQKLSYLCTIKAPKTGILVHKYERNGEKISVGSVVSVWNNIIAILPDLSQLISKTYINEIDINKIQTGMKAEISLDALPNKKYFGKIYI